ncbi:hypothetical protein E2320_019407 [Naja naja]|nr:hypothetical protein E2320_019407 [Naja naja]
MQTYGPILKVMVSDVQGAIECTESSKDFIHNDLVLLIISKADWYHYPPFEMVWWDIKEYPLVNQKYYGSYSFGIFILVFQKPAPPKPESKPRKSAKKEPGTKANKGSKGKKDEKQDAAKEGTTPSENGESKAEEILISRSTVSVSTSRGTELNQ